MVRPVVGSAACAARARRLITEPAAASTEAETEAGANAATGRTVVATRGLETAAVLAESAALDVVMLGGSVRKLSHGLVGPLTDLALDRLTFAVAFLGADAVDPYRGLGEPTLEETAVKERVAARSHRVVVLAHASKLEVRETPAWTSFGGGWTLVTDQDAPADLERRCAAAGVELVRARRRAPEDS